MKKLTQNDQNTIKGKNKLKDTETNSGGQHGKKKKKQGFTLVELIVVITILAILGTIAFISFQGYSKNARNGARLADLNNISKSLELFYSEKGFLPTPDGAIDMTYSGSTAWKQGTFGDTNLKNVENINKKPLDPLTQNEYTYSITNLKNEYQLGAIYEGGSLTYEKTINNPLIPQANAAGAIKANAMVIGNYNGKLIKINTGTTLYILAVPSIINGDITNIDIVSMMTNKTLVYNDYSNLPDSYKNKGYSMTGGFDFVPQANILVYSGTTASLKTEDNRVIFIDNLKKVYNNTIIAQDPNYTQLVQLDTSANKLQAVQLANSIIDNYVGKGIAPQNQTALTNPYIGCISIGQILQATTTYPGVTITGVQPSHPACDTSDIIICAGSGTGYTLSACNIGASIAGTGASSYGYRFQWGRNKGFPDGAVVQQPGQISGLVGLNSLSDTFGFVWGASFSSPYPWANTNIDNNWGDITNTNIARQGPCAIGYHVPTNIELGAIQIAGGWTSNLNSAVYAMRDSLKLPLAGYRAWNSGLVSAVGAGYYWESTSHSLFGNDYGRFISLNTAAGTKIQATDANYRALGFPIRCIKN